MERKKNTLVELILSNETINIKIDPFCGQNNVSQRLSDHRFLCSLKP
jgi:hypothetical protein